VGRDVDLDGVRGRLLGLIPEERIVTVAVERPPAETVAAFLAIADMCSTVSDALDELGVGGAIAGSVIQPRVPGARVCGPAITIRYALEGGSVGALVQRGERAKLADRDLYGVGRPGDVAVFDCGGFARASVMGGLSGRWARRLGIAGCIVDGGVRDLEAIRSEGVPVWSRAVTPVSGKHRLAALEINGDSALDGVPVRPGDLVLADETGVCVVPRAHVGAMLDVCRRADEAERSLVAAIGSGLAPEEIMRILAPDRW
jgi:4-hydroxy-4-methyl-2-oxoglutarate aldolase